MNDLMTYSFVGYTNLDDEEEGDPTKAEASAADEKLRRFLAEAEAANKEMAAIRHLLAGLQQAHGETNYSLSDPDSLRSIRRRINADLLLAIRTARDVRARLDAMDSDPEPTAASSVGAGLRSKLRELIADLQELRRRMAADHREAVARCYFAITGERPDEALLDRIASMSGGDELMLLKKAVAEGGGGDGDLVVAVQEMEDRQEVASGLERSLLELQQLFLDMAVLVEAQAQHLDDIEQQVAAAADFVGNGAQDLEDARQYQKSARRKSAWIALAILLLLLLILAVVVAVVAINLSKKSTHLSIYIFTW